MSRVLLIAAVAACSVFFASQTFAEDDNPYKKASVGDWVEYKSVTEMANGPKMESAMKQTVTAVTEKEVAVKIDMDVMGRQSSNETKIDITKAYDPKSALGASKNSKAEKIGEGDEKITVGGKDYQAHWIEMKTATNAGPLKMTGNSKLWMSKDVKLSGMVKMESTQSIGTKMTMELTGSGSK